MGSWLFSVPSVGGCFGVPSLFSETAIKLDAVESASIETEIVIMSKALTKNTTA
jgi:hypothetical protein